MPAGIQMYLLVAAQGHKGGEARREQMAAEHHGSAHEGYVEMVSNQSPAVVTYQQLYPSFPCLLTSLNVAV